MLGVGAILSRAVEPGVRVEKIMLTTNTAALRIFPATPDLAVAITKGPHPVALLAHGNGGSKEMLFRFGEALAAAGFNRYSVDQAGYGESPLACSVTNLMRSSRELERALDPVDVFVGHSMGGGVGEWSVREAGFRPRLFIGVGAPVKLGEHGPPLLLLGGLFEEFFRPAQLRARTDTPVVISPWCEHILEAYDPVLVRSFWNLAHLGAQHRRSYRLRRHSRWFFPVALDAATDAGLQFGHQPPGTSEAPERN
jgi:pimeloyl-ACP methyl ester carboxylesterase